MIKQEVNQLTIKVRIDESTFDHVKFWYIFLRNFVGVKLTIAVPAFIAASEVSQMWEVAGLSVVKHCHIITSVWVGNWDFAPVEAELSAYFEKYESELKKLSPADSVLELQLLFVKDPLGR